VRIGLIVPGFSASEADWCIPALLDLARVLAESHEVHIFAIRYPHRTGTYRVYGATVHAFGGAGAGGLRRAPLLFRVMAEVVREHRVAPFDVLHGLWADEPGFVAVTAAHRLRIPSLVSLLGGELVQMPESDYGGQLSQVNRLLTRVALRSAGRVTVGSVYLRGIAEAFVSGDRLAVLPLGVDDDRFSPIGESARLVGTPALLHVASLVPVKDQATLLHALAQIQIVLPDVHLHIVGEGGLRDDLVRLAAMLEIRDAVTFHGPLEHDRLPCYYRAADACLLTSRFESQGMVVLEAAACGTPTFGTSVGLLPEFWSAVPTVPVGDSAALADAIVETSREPGGFQARGERARRVVSERYLLGQTVARLDRLYRDIRTD
jgi:glycosyltransferase involved in cell wall biosynthesis